MAAVPLSIMAAVPLYGCRAPMHHGCCRSPLFMPLRPNSMTQTGQNVIGHFLWVGGWEGGGGLCVSFFTPHTPIPLQTPFKNMLYMYIMI
jgi:hypothetical protein